MGKMTTPWSGKQDTHPIMIAIGPNPEMDCWDIHVMVGNYRSPEDARFDADTVKAAVELALETTLSKPQ